MRNKWGGVPKSSDVPSILIIDPRGDSMSVGLLHNLLSICKFIFIIKIHEDVTNLKKSNRIIAVCFTEQH